MNLRIADASTSSGGSTALQFLHSHLWRHVVPGKWKRWMHWQYWHPYSTINGVQSQLTCLTLRLVIIWKVDNPNLTFALTVVLCWKGPNYGVPTTIYCRYLLCFSYFYIPTLKLLPWIMIASSESLAKTNFDLHIGENNLTGSSQETWAEPTRWVV